MDAKFDTLQKIVMEPPGLLEVFKRVQVASPRLAAFVAWNVQVLERCIRERAVDDLMAWESTMRSFLMANMAYEHTLFYRVLMARLNKLVFAFDVHCFETLHM